MQSSPLPAQAPPKSSPSPVRPPLAQPSAQAIASTVILPAQQHQPILHPFFGQRKPKPFQNVILGYQLGFSNNQLESAFQQVQDPTFFFAHFHWHLGTLNSMDIYGGRCTPAQQDRIPNGKVVGYTLIIDSSTYPTEKHVSKFYDALFGDHRTFGSPEEVEELKKVPIQVVLVGSEEEASLGLFCEKMQMTKTSRLNVMHVESVSEVNTETMGWLLEQVDKQK